MPLSATAPEPENPSESEIGHSFIEHPVARAALKNLDRLFKAKPSADAGWCGLLTGPTGSGKSALLRAFCSEHKPFSNPGLIQPVVSVELPDKCTTRALSDVLLDALHHPASGRQMSIAELQKAAVAHLIKQQTKCVVFDEAQHALRGDAYEVANFFKHILNRAKVNILLCGLPSTIGLLKNPQLQSRAIIKADLRAFDWWNPKDKGIFLGILKKLQETLRTPVLNFNFFDFERSWRLSYGSRGLMRPIVKYFLLLDLVASEKEPPQITDDMLMETWDLIPSDDLIINQNPFELANMPAKWKPAASTTGERAKSSGK